MGSLPSSGEPKILIWRSRRRWRRGRDSGHGVLSQPSVRATLEIDAAAFLEAAEGGAVIPDEPGPQGPEGRSERHSAPLKEPEQEEHGGGQGDRPDPEVDQGERTKTPARASTFQKRAGFDVSRQ